MNNIQRGLKQYKKKVLDEVRKGIANTAAKQMTNASSAAPVDTGNLKQSIDLDIKDGGFEATVTVGAHYGAYIEFGTGIYSTKGSKAKKIPWTYYSEDFGWVTTYGMPAQPFWYPSLDITRRYFDKYFNN